MTIIPNKISYQIIPRLYIKGSNNEAKKAPHENIANVIDILDSSIAPKKVIQCNAIIIPEINSFNNKLLETLMFFLKIKTYKNKTIKAIVILNHTNSIESTEINEPSIAVKPKIKTIK